MGGIREGGILWKNLFFGLLLGAILGVVVCLITEVQESSKGD